MLRSCALASVVACGLVGCALDFDAIGFTGGGGEGASSTTSSDVTGSGSSSSSGSTATGPGECDEAGECLPPAPAGWVGPGALFEDSACPVGQVPLFEGGDDGTATSCPCSPVGPVCTNAYVSFFDDEECMTTRATSTLIPTQDVCQPNGMLIEPPIGANIQAQPSPNPGVCQLQPGFVPEVSYFAGLTSICGFEPVPSGCGTDACVPSGIACIAAPDPAGVAECPGDYPTLRTQKYKITPTCTACPSWPDLNCDGSIEVHDDAMCQGASLGSLIVNPPSTCQTFVLSTGTLYLKYVLDTPPSCAPAEPALAYEAWTVCCQ